VNEVDKQQTAKKRQETKHRVRGEDARIKKSLQAVAREHGKARPGGRLRPGICLIASLINGHCSSPLPLRSRRFRSSLLSGKCLPVSPCDNSYAESAQIVPKRDDKAALLQCCQAEPLSAARLQSLRTRIPGCAPIPGSRFHCSLPAPGT